MLGGTKHINGGYNGLMISERRPPIMFGMASDRRSEEDERRILRCAACEGTVFAETALGRSDANTACALCGMTSTDSSVLGGAYFDVLMRVGRPMWRDVRLRRAG